MRGNERGIVLGPLEYSLLGKRGLGIEGRRMGWERHLGKKDVFFSFHFRKGVRSVRRETELLLSLSDRGHWWGFFLKAFGIVSDALSFMRKDPGF